MAEKIVSPGVFTNEIDQSFIPAAIGELGAAIVGPTVKGPVLTPTVVSSFSEFSTIFGDVIESGSDKYQYFALDFSKSNSAANIETRFLNYSSATTDIYLDHILILPRINHGFEGGTGVFDY